MRLDAPEDGHIWLPHVGHFHDLLIVKLIALDGSFEFSLLDSAFNMRLEPKSPYRIFRRSHWTSLLCDFLLKV
jgi:hypothetical protein